MSVEFWLLTVAVMFVAAGSIHDNKPRKDQVLSSLGFLMTIGLCVLSVIAELLS